MINRYVKSFLAILLAAVFIIMLSAGTLADTAQDPGADDPKEAISNSGSEITGEGGEAVQQDEGEEPENKPETQEPETPAPEGGNNPGGKAEQPKDDKSTQKPESVEDYPPVKGEPAIQYAKAGSITPDPTSIPDTIAVDKKAGRTTDKEGNKTGCRTFEVTLDITGTPQLAPVDVVLAIDRSGSMNDKDGTGRQSRLYYAKEAAADFAAQVLGSEEKGYDGIPGSRVSIVSYSGPTVSTGPGSIGNENQATIDQKLTTVLKDVNKAIDDLKAEGGTNTQAGFNKAKSEIETNGKEGHRKVVIMFTDGMPTSSNGNSYGPNNPTVHNIHTKAAYEAGQHIYNEKIADVFTVGLLGGLTGNVRKLAVDTLKKAQNKGYYEAPTAGALEEIFGVIAQRLGYSATKAKVVDKIGDNFDLIEDSLPEGAIYNPTTREITWEPGTIEIHSQLKYTVQAKPEFVGGLALTNEYANLSYKDPNGASGSKGFPKPKVDVPTRLEVSLSDATINYGDSISLGTGAGSAGENYMNITGGDGKKDENGNLICDYEWREVANPAVISNERNPTVEPAEDTKYELTVTDSNGCVAVATMLVTVRVPTGSIAITKKVENYLASKDKNQVFDILVFKDGVLYTTVSLKHNENKTINNLPLGTYTIKEVVPMNYKKVGITNRSITLNSSRLAGETIIKNKRSNDGWFHDNDEKNNKFKVSVSWGAN
ncbi:MAG: VWA domain-containing protein [Clostridiales bacterium]|nr:VWA domain-containing protein [Clostridiales bacterium]